MAGEIDASFGVQLETGDGDPSDPTRNYKFVARRRLFRNGAGQSDGANPCIISLGHPPVGRYWEVNTIAVMTGTPQTQVAAAAWGLYIGQRLPGANQPPDISACVVPAFGNNVPGGRGFGRHQISAVTGEHVYVVIFGGAATGYTVNMQGWDRDEAELLDADLIPIQGDVIRT